MAKRILISVVALGVLGILGFGALAWRPAIAPIAPPAPGSFAPALVAKGEALAGGGYCADCHTANGGQKFAGGYAMATPFGVIYSTNITPDPETGIGTWSEAAFARAVREGVARDGSLLFPAFPYDHFTKLSDDDVKALYAYFMTRAPVRARHARIVSRFHSTSATCRPDGGCCSSGRGASNRMPSKSRRMEPWGLPCGGAKPLRRVSHAAQPARCRKGQHAYAGAVIDNWIAPPLTAANPTPAPWTQDELFSYLRNGVSILHGSAAGPMAPVVHGLSALPEEDVRALATYFADVDHAGDRLASVDPAVARAMSYASLDAAAAGQARRGRAPLHRRLRVLSL